MACPLKFYGFEDPFKPHRLVFRGEPRGKEHEAAGKLERTAEQEIGDAKALELVNQEIKEALEGGQFSKLDAEKQQEWNEFIIAVANLAALKENRRLTDTEYNTRLEGLKNDFLDRNLSAVERANALRTEEAARVDLVRFRADVEAAPTRVIIAQRGAEERLSALEAHMEEVPNWDSEFAPQILSQISQNGRLLTRKEVMDLQGLEGKTFEATFGKGVVSSTKTAELARTKGLFNVFAGLPKDAEVTIARIRNGVRQEATRDADGNFYFNTAQYGKTRMGVKVGDRVEVVSVTKGTTAKTEQEKQEEFFTTERQKETEKATERRTVREAEVSYAEGERFKDVLSQAETKFGQEGVAALPQGLRWRSRAFWERNILSGVKGGQEAVRAADEIKNAAGLTKSGVELFLDALDRGLSDNCMRAKDILREAGYKNTREFMERYNSLKNYSSRTPSQERELQKMQKILVNGYQLMQIVEDFELNESFTEEEVTSLEISEEAEQVINILDKVFPADDGFRTKAGPFGLGRRDATYYTESLLHSRRRSRAGLTMTSGDSMRDQMIAQYTTPNLDSGQYEGDVQGLVDHLERLRRWGVSQIILPDHKDLQRRFKIKVEPGMNIDDFDVEDITAENAGNLPELDKVLIRLGLAFTNSANEELEERNVRKKESPEEVLSILDQEPEEVKTVAVGIYNEAKKLGVELTSDQIKEIVKNLNTAHAEICSLGTVGAVSSTTDLTQVRTEERTTEGIPRAIKVKETVGQERRIILGYNKTFVLLRDKKGNPLVTLDGGFTTDGRGLKRIVNLHGALGVKKRFGKNDRQAIGVKGGGLLGPDGPAVFTSVDYSIQLDKYGEYEAQAEVGVFAPLGKNPLLPQAVLIRMGLARNLEGAGKRHQERILEKDIKPILEAQLQQFDAFTSGDPDTQAAIRTAYYERCYNAAQIAGTKELNALQITDLGVVLVIAKVAGVRKMVPIPYFAFAIKGRSEWTRVIPAGVELDAVAQAKLDKVTKGRAMQDIYVAGDLEFGAQSGKLTIQESETSLDAHTIFNQGFRSEGLNFSPDANGLRMDIPADLVGTRIEIVPDNVHGGDGHSKIQIYQVGGRYYLNLDPDEQRNLRVHVVETDYGDQKDGFTHHMKIFLLADPSSSIQTMRGADSLVVERPSEGPGKIFVVGEGRTVFRSKEAMEGSGVRVGRYVEDLADRETAGQEMSATLEQAWGESHLVLEEAFQNRLYQLAETYKGTLDYKRITTDRAYTEALIKRVQRDHRDIAWDDAAINQFLQAAITVSRVQFEADAEKFAEYVAGWNKEAIRNLCLSQGIGEADAETIAKTISGYYKENILTQLEDGKEIPVTKVEEGRLVHIRTGRRGKDFLAFLHTQQSREVELVGEMDLTEKNLVEVVGLSPALAQAFIRASRQDLAHLENFDVSNAESILRSRYGLALSEYAHGLFGAKTSRMLNRLYKNPEKVNDLNEEEQIAWKTYIDLVTQLKTNGYAKYGEMEIHTNDEMAMAFCKECRNFTTTLDYNLRIVAPEAELKKIAVREGGQGTLTAKFLKIGLALGALKKERPLPGKKQATPTHEGTGIQYQGPIAEGITTTINPSTASQGQAEI